MIVYYFDENMSTPLANALNDLGAGTSRFKVMTVIEEFNRVGATDPEIVDRLLQKDHRCVIVTCDSDFRKRQLYKLIIDSENLGLLHIKFPRGAKAWDQYVFTITCWEKVTKLSKFPFLYVLKGNKKLYKI